MSSDIISPNRRDFIRIGGLTALGIGLTDLVRLRAASAPQRANAKAKSCILIWLDGGASHLDSFDPKPNSPAEVRGPFAPIQTVIPGVQVSELLPRTAAMLDQIALIRSVTSPLGEHNFGTHYLLSGYKSTPALQYPSYGCVLSHLHDSASDLPAHVAVPNMRVGGGKFRSQGFLPATVAPFEVGGDPEKPNFRVQNLEPFSGITTTRIARRREYLRMLDQVDQSLQTEANTPTDPAFEQAYRLITSRAARRAFDLSAEEPSTRQRYGSKSIGQSCLLARRLIERGVPFVTVNNTGWDTHNNAYTRLKEGYTGARVPVGLVPSLDLAFSALIDDLAARNLLEETLVVVMGEFGRTPKLNTAGGRDHWPRVFSVVMAGGGIPGGQVVGSSDSMGESPQDRPVTPADLACTLYTLLGIDPDTILRTPDDRPVTVSHGKPISELIG